MGSAPNRLRLLGLAAICIAIVAVLAVMVELRWDALQDLDTDVGGPAEAWSFGHPAAVRVLIGIEIAFGTVAMALYLLVLAAVLWVRGHRPQAFVSSASSGMAGSRARPDKLLLPVWSRIRHRLGYGCRSSDDPVVRQQLNVATCSVHVGGRAGGGGGGRPHPAGSPQPLRCRRGICGRVLLDCGHVGDLPARSPLPPRVDCP